ncbi:MAG: DUF3417 domain-containing protein, partial [Microbacteriaceae bacterium]|nr:DUF3417 domain-containing protein [Microbacteriaceae bacterium]
LSPELSADRMVKEYVTRLYVPAAEAERTISSKSFTGARELAAWKMRVRDAWPLVAVTHVESGGVDTVPQVGDILNVRAHVQLDGLTPDDVAVEVVYGRAREGDNLERTHHVALEPETATPGVAVQFVGSVPLTRAGSFGYNVRVTPRHPLLASAAELGLIAVAD